MYTAISKSFKILASFCSWAGWFECYLVENSRRHIFGCGSCNVWHIHSGLLLKYFLYLSLFQIGIPFAKTSSCFHKPYYFFFIYLHIFYCGRRGNQNYSLYFWKHLRYFLYLIHVKKAFFLFFFKKSCKFPIHPHIKIFCITESRISQFSDLLYKR